MLMLDEEYIPNEHDKRKYQKEITFANGIKTMRIIKRIEQQYETKYNKEGEKITVEDLMKGISMARNCKRLL